MIKTYIVYQAISPSNGYYIGISYRSLKTRVRDHYYKANKQNVQTRIAKAIRKYGDAITWHVLEAVDTLKEAKKLEIRYIAELKQKGINLYNTTAGGDMPWNLGVKGYKWKKESIIKRTATRKEKGYKHSESTIKKISSGNKGKIVRPDTALKILKTRGDSGVEVFKLDGTFIGSWLNKAQCARELKILQGGIYKCLMGVAIQYKGYKFKYVGKDFTKTVDKRFRLND